MAFHEQGGAPPSPADLIALLDRFAGRLAQAATIKEILDTVLGAALDLHGTGLGTMQLFDSATQTLHIAAQSGFKRAFLDHFREVRADDDSVCGRALREGRPIAILDLNSDSHHTPIRIIAAQAGFSAVQSTPLVTSTGRVIGMLSTHFPQSSLPGNTVMLLTRLYARLSADKIALMPKPLDYRDISNF